MAPESFSPNSQISASVGTCYRDSSPQMDTIRNSERIAEIRDHLNGKSFSDNETIHLYYPDTSCARQEMVFDIGGQTILVWREKIKLTLPYEANITQVSFHANSIRLEGKKAFVTGTGETTYENFITAIDRVIQHGYSTITSGDREIALSKQVNR